MTTKEKKARKLHIQSIIKNELIASVSKQNLAHIEDIIANLAREGRSTRKGTFENYRKVLHKLGKFLGEKDMKDATKEDLKKFWDLMAKGLVKSSLMTQMSILKNSYRQLFEMPKREYPEAVKWIAISYPEPVKELRESDLWTVEDVQAAVKKARSPMEACLLKVLAESGCRKGEILAISLKEITILGDRTTFNISKTVSKTKTGRQVELISSTPDVKLWLNHHSDRDNPNAKLFPISGPTVGVMIRRMAKAAGIAKPCNAHIFRHSRSMYLHRQGVPKQVIDLMQGWKKGSKMFDLHYSHFGQQDVREWTDRLNGSEVEIPKPTSMSVLTADCPSCHFKAPSQYSFCPNCGEHMSREETEKALQKVTEMEIQKTADMARMATEMQKMKSDFTEAQEQNKGLWDEIRGLIDIAARNPRHDKTLREVISTLQKEEHPGTAQKVDADDREFAEYMKKKGDPAFG